MVKDIIINDNKYEVIKNYRDAFDEEDEDEDALI